MKLLAALALCCLVVFTVFLSLRGFNSSHEFYADNLYQMTVAAASIQEEAFLQEFEKQLLAFLREAANGIVAAMVFIPSTVELHQQKVLSKYRLPQKQQLAAQQLVADFISQPFPSLTPLLCDRAMTWVVDRGFHIPENTRRCAKPDRGSYCQHCTFSFSWSRHLPVTGYW